jgi:spore coat protein H
MRARASAWLAYLCTVCLLFGLVGCDAGQVTSAFQAIMGTTKTTIAGSEAERLDELVFPKDQVIDVKITMDPSDFQSMLDHASEEEYKTASVEYNGQQIDHVAIRTKGNLSLRSVVGSNSERYSFKLAFDEFITSQNLQGVTKINLNNNYSDATYMREFLAYELAEAMGLPTPKYAYVNVYVNEELKGLYLAVEQIGDAYLKRHYGNSYGALYKAIQGNGSDLKLLADMKAYTGLSLKSESSHNNIVLDMLRELNQGTNYEKYIDVEQALRFIALNTVSLNMDSYLGPNKHNYYMYEDEGVFHFLPWDYNMAFGGHGGSGLLIDEPTQVAVTERPLLDRLLKVNAYKEKYHDILRAALEGYLKQNAFRARVQEIAQLISPHVKQDPTAFYTYEQYEQGITQLTQLMGEQAVSFTQQLDGTILSSGTGAGSGSRGGPAGIRGGLPPGGEGRPARANAAGGPPAGRPDGREAAGPPAGRPPGAMPPSAGGAMGRPGGMPGFSPDAAKSGVVLVDSTTEAATTVAALGLLGFACLFMHFYRRKQL